jgi:modulator of FtsH protease HflK
MARKTDDALLSAHAILTALRSSICVLRWGMFALVVVYLASGITNIGPNEVGLILRLGKVLPQIHQPGLLFAFPNPIDEVVKVPVKTLQEISLQTWALREGEDPSPYIHPVRYPYTLTGDANIIRAKFSARYQIADPIAYVFAAKDRDEISRAILYQAACRALAGMSVDDMLTTRRDIVAQETMRVAQEELDRLCLGIRIIAFEAREINPPNQVLPAFQDVVSARVEAKTLVEPAKAYHASAIPEAESQAYRIQQEADAYAQQLVAKAKGEASSFVALAKEFQASPELIRTRLYSEMLEGVMPKLRISMITPSAQGEVRLLLAPQRADGGYNEKELSNNDPSNIPLPTQSHSPRNKPEKTTPQKKQNADEE